MNNNITTYYIPTNPNINKGSIYTLYINKNTNLDLTSIINETPTNQTTITIDTNNYNNLINISEQLEKTISNLTKLNSEYQSYLKTFLIKGDNK